MSTKENFTPVNPDVSTSVDWSNFFERSSDLISALSNFAWPAVVLLLLYITRHRTSELISVAIRRIEAATEIEIGGVKIKGAVLNQTGDVIRDDKDSTEIISASKTDLERRDEIYANSRNLFLVHTIRPAKPKRYVDEIPVFDVSVYVTAHRNRGHINDVRSITYYFGDKWGKSKHGSKYMVESANNCFALTAQMWGACWCVAELKFHDSTETVILERYLDVEMAPVYGIPLEQAREGTP